MQLRSLSRERVLNLGSVELFCDHESGNWRLCVDGSSAELSLSDLRKLSTHLALTIVGIDCNPNKNAELSAARSVTPPASVSSSSTTV